MTLLWQAPAVVLALIVWLTAPPMSLADVARKEQLRRQLTEASVGTFTNQDLPPSTAVAAPDTPPAAVTEAAPPAVTPPVEAPPEDVKKTESYWRKRIDDARSALERDQVLQDAMQARINSLNTDVVNRDDPAQQAQLRNQLQRALTEFDRLAKQIAAGQQAIKDIQEEARKARVPPGWIR